MRLAARKGLGQVCIKMLQLGVSPVGLTGGGFDTYSPLLVALCFLLEDFFKHLWSIECVRSDVVAAADCLSFAARDGRVEFIRRLLSHPSPLNANTPGFRVKLPLHWAAEFGQAPAVEILLSFGASRTATNQFGKTALHLVCSKSEETDQGDSTRASIVRMLLSAAQGMSVLDARCIVGRTPLMCAVQNQLPACCDALLNATSKALDIPDNQGLRPLQLSEPNSRVRAVLLEHGALEYSDCGDDDGQT